MVELCKQCFFLARAPAMCAVNTDLISGHTLNQPVMSLNKVCIGKVVCVNVEMKDFEEPEGKASCTHYTQ